MGCTLKANKPAKDDKMAKEKPAKDDKETALVKMKKGEVYADVHPNEVENFSLGGYVLA